MAFSAARDPAVPRGELPASAELCYTPDVLYDAVLDSLMVTSRETHASVDATFSWYFRDEDRWITVESHGGKVNIQPGMKASADMKFYSACVADFIHQHATEGAGKTIFQGGGFYWRGDITRLKDLAPLCKLMFGPRLHQKLVGAGIAVPKFEVRRYPARTKAQRDRILAEWINHGERPGHQAVRSTPPRAAVLSAPTPPPASAPVVAAAAAAVASTKTKRGTKTAPTVKGAAKTAKSVRAAKTVAAPKARRAAAPSARASSPARRAAR